MTDRLVLNDQVVEATRSALSRGESGLANVPGLIARVIREDMWRRRVITRTGEPAEFTRFIDFVTTEPLEGLGADVRLLKRICQDDKTALDLLDKALKGRQGERTDLLDNIQEVAAPTGTSERAALRRLRKDRPDLHAAVLAGEKSAHAAMVEAGFRPRTATIRVDDVSRAVASLLRYYTADEIRGAL